MSGSSLPVTSSPVNSSEVSTGRSGLTRNIFRSIVRSWWIPVCLSLALGAIAIVGSALQTPMYRSSAAAYVTAGVEADSQSAYQGSLASQQRVASYALLATSDSILQSALEGSSLDVSIEDAKASVSAVTTPGTVLLSISAEDADADQAARLANAVASSLSSYVTELERPSSGGAPLAKMTVVTPAVPNESPVAPRTLRNLLMGLFIGLILGSMVAVLRSRFDTKIHNSSDLRQATAFALMAEVPSDDEIDSVGLVDFKSGASMGAEAYRRLRTSLSFANVDEPVKTVLVTSASSGEGKTTTCLNLGASLAEAGHRVVVVDGDLRRPMVGRRLAAQTSVGFTDVLRGRVPLDDVVQSTSWPGMSFVPSGVVPPNPSELLGSARAGEVIDQLSSDFDYVLVDSPPVGPVTDAEVLAQWVDGVIVVVFANRSRIPELSASIDRLRSANASVLGVVLNGARVPERKYKYGLYREASTDSSQADAGQQDSHLTV